MSWLRGRDGVSIYATHVGVYFVNSLTRVQISIFVVKLFEPAITPPIRPPLPSLLARRLPGRPLFILLLREIAHLHLLMHLLLHLLLHELLL